MNTAYNSSTFHESDSLKFMLTQTKFSLNNTTQSVHYLQANSFMGYKYDLNTWFLIWFRFNVRFKPSELIYSTNAEASVTNITVQLLSVITNIFIWFSCGYSLQVFTGAR